MKKRTATVGTITALAAAAGIFVLAGDGNGQRKQDTSVRCGLTENGVLQRLETHRNQCPPDPEGKPQNKWLPAPIVPAPAYNPETQVLEGPTYTVEPTVIVESWNVRAKTAEELENDRTAVIGGMNPATKSAICDLHKRLQTQEGTQPTIATEAECDAWLATFDAR